MRSMGGRWPRRATWSTSTCDRVAPRSTAPSSRSRSSTRAGSVSGELVSERWPVRFREELPADHDYDLILLSVQHYRFAEAAAFLGPRTGKATVPRLQHFWVEPQAAAAPLTASQLV